MCVQYSRLHYIYCAFVCLVLADTYPMSSTAPYAGEVVRMSIPAELHERDGHRYYSSDGVVPIHCCTEEQIKQLSFSTHHYCDVFTERVLAPIEDTLYVRLDDTFAEKVSVNRSLRILVTSSDGVVAQWRAAPTFHSSNKLCAGAPLVTARGLLVGVITARRRQHYAVSGFDGAGGYFETSLPWSSVDASSGLVYGDLVFPSRDELRAHVRSLPPPGAACLPGPFLPPRPVVHVVGGGGGARVALVAAGGRQLAHLYMHDVTADGIEYL